MQGGLVGFPRRMSQWIIEKRRAWRVHRPCNVEGAAHAQGRDAGGFDVPGEQSNGLMADGSHGHEQDGIDMVGQEALGESWGEFLTHAPRRVDAAHERIGMGGQRTDDPFTHQTT